METEFRDESIAMAQAIKAHAEKKGLTATQFALAWVLRNRIISGLSRAVVVSMSPKALARVMEFVSQCRRFNRRIAAFPTQEAARQWLESERREH